jgi:cytochrome P450
MTHLSVLTRPSQLKALFNDSDKHQKALNNDSGYFMSQILGKCVGLINPPSWNKVRAVTEVPFRHDAVVFQTAVVQRHVEAHFARLHQASELSRGLIHPAKDLKMLPFWVVCEMFYGTLPEDYLTRIGDLASPREQLMKHVMRGGLTRFAFSQWLPTQANRALRDFKAKWKQLNREILRFCQQYNQSSPIITMWKNVYNGDIAEDQLLQTLDEALFANLDVTTGGLSWNLVYLAAYKEVQEKLRAEVEGFSLSENIAGYLKRQTSLLQCCVMESSRLKPLAAFSVPQSAPTDRVVDGYVIPAMSNIVVDSYSLNINNEYWGPDNHTYRPERFMNRNNTELRYLFWRFGFGPRQ